MNTNNICEESTSDADNGRESQAISGQGEPEHAPGLTFGEAWDIQHSVGPSLDHDPKCSSVPGHHPLSGAHLLCDCGAIEREWNRRHSTAPAPAAVEEGKRMHEFTWQCVQCGTMNGLHREGCRECGLSIYKSQAAEQPTPPAERPTLAEKIRSHLRVQFPATEGHIPLKDMLAQVANMERFYHDEMNRNSALERQLAEAKRLERERNETANVFMQQVKNLQAQLDERTEQREQLIQKIEPTYQSFQQTECAGCGKLKHTPLRRDEMGGYVCLTCVDKRLDELEPVTEQRDRLAEAFSEWPRLREWLEMDSFIRGYMSAELPAFDAMSKALAAVKG